VPILEDQDWPVTCSGWRRGDEHGDVVIQVGSPEDLHQPVWQVGDRQPGGRRLDQASR
jgi:hypothetical protein